MFLQMFGHNSVLVFSSLFSEQLVNAWLTTQLSYALKITQIKNTFHSIYSCIALLARSFINWMIDEMMVLTDRISKKDLGRLRLRLAHFDEKLYKVFKILNK